MDEQAFDRIQCIELLTNCYYKSEEKQWGIGFHSMEDKRVRGFSIS